MTVAIQSDPSLQSMLFYLNVHSSWSPPSPMGALAGEVGAVTPTPATTTSAPGPSLTTTTSGGPVLPTTSSQCPLTCCQFGAIPSTGYTDFTITMDYQFNRFDCAAFKGT